MKIEVFGVGCPKCRATKKLIDKAVRVLQVDAEVVEVSDVDEIIGRGVMVTPVVFVDGKLECSGWVPKRREVEGWLSARSGGSEVTEAGANKIEAPCACLYYATEQVKMIKKAPSLHKLTCKGCGKEFSSNVEKDYCFECEKKGR
jgi:small redox-active disulfide protein 2